MIVIGGKVYKTKDRKVEIDGMTAEIPLSKFRVSSDRPDLLGRAGNDVEIDAVDETAAIAEFIKLNTIDPSETSKHRYTAEVLEENRLEGREMQKRQAEAEQKALKEFQKHHNTAKKSSD